MSAYSIAFTTRVGGVSEGPYASLNLGLLTDDDPACVAENRRLACAGVGADPQRLAMNRQVHGATVNRAVAGGRGEEGDGLWTDEPGLPLLALTADCLPIVLTRAGAHPAVAVLHAGRLGLLAGVVAAGAHALGGGGLEAVVGPGIGACCYQVGEEIRGAYHARFGNSVIAGDRVDLRAAATCLLRQAGAKRIEHVEACTACETTRFFSHRRDGERTGRQGVIAHIA